MSVKPTTTQACNTHSCSITRCDMSNRFLRSGSYGSRGGACDHNFSSSSSSIIWNNVRITSGHSASATRISYGGYTYYRNQQFDSSSSSCSNSCPCVSWSESYCVTRS